MRHFAHEMVLMPEVPFGGAEAGNDLVVQHTYENTHMCVLATCPYVGNPYVGNSYVGNSYVGNSYVGNSYVGNSYVVSRVDASVSRVTHM